jgi:type III pantothenate kinase
MPREILEGSKSVNVLTLDFGNTRPHAALFRNDQLTESGLVSDISGWMHKHSLGFGDVSAVLSEVRQYNDQLDPLIKEGLLIDRVKDYWKGEKFAGMPVRYEKSLGEDRLIAGWWAYRSKELPVMVIDAGSFITVDVITSDGFQGGHILPGFQLWQQMIDSGEKLNATKAHGLKPEIITLQELPHETAQAIQGLWTAYAQLIEKSMLRFNMKSVLLTGGDSERLQRILNPLLPHVQIQVEKNLQHLALYEWFRRNISL